MRSLASNTIQSTLIGIQKNLSSIRSLTTTTLVGQKKVELVRRRDLEKDKRQKKEDKLESFKSSLSGIGKNIPKKVSSGFGILDFIKNFATFVFWGFIFNKLIPFLPNIKKILPVLDAIQTTFEGIADFIGNSFVNFIDFAYDKKESLRKVAKQVGGEDFEKKFDDFSKNFTSFLNIAVVGGLLLAGSGILPTKKTPNVKPTTIPRGNVRGGSAKITTSGGRTVRNIPGRGAAPKITTSGGKSASRLARFGRAAGSKSIPLIGPLLNFGIRVLAGDNPGKAAAGSVGMGIGQSIGAFIGGLGAGALGLGTGGLALVVAPLIIGASSIIGGLVGEWIGDALYDFVSTNSNSQSKIQKKAGGGKITRNGKPIGGPIRRGVKPRKKLPRRSRPTPSIPGKNVGGLKNIEKIFPDTKDKEKVNPLGTLKHTAATYKTIPIVGKLMGSAIEGSFGQRMERKVITDFSDTIGSMVQNLVDGNNISRSEIMAMVGGGMVPPRTSGLDNSTVGEQISSMLKQNLDIMMNNKMTQVFNNLNKEFGKQSYLGSPSSLGDEYNLNGDGSEDGSLSSINISGFSEEDVDALGRMIAAESGGESAIGKASVLAVILNRYRLIKSGQVPPSAFFVVNKPKEQITIRDILFAGGKGAGNQFSPYADGNFDSTSSTSGAAALEAAINAGGNDPEKLKENLIKTAKLSEIDAEYVVRSISFSNPVSRDSLPFNTREVAVGRHVFQQSNNAQLKGKIGRIDATISQSVSMGKIPKADYIKGVLDESGESGFDVTWKGDNNIAILPGRVKEVGQLYGSGYGNVVVIESIDPVTGKKVDVMYAHFPTGGISVREGQQVNTGQVLGRMGKPGERGIGNINGQHASIDFYEPNKRRGQITGKYSRWAGLSREVIYAAQTGNNPNNWPKQSPRSNASNKGQYDVLIPLDHVKTSALTDDPRYPNASLGAEGIERRYQDQAAAQVKANLERSGLRVKIMAPESYGGYAAYDAFIRNQTKGGAIVVPIHLDAVTSAGGVGALTRIRAGDAGDKALARTIDPVLKAFTRKHGLSYGGTDTQSNKTVNLSGSNSASVLIELGVQAELRRKFGPDFMQHPEVKRLLAEISNALIRVKRANPTPQRVAQLTTPTTNKTSNTIIASNYTIPTIERTVILKQKEIRKIETVISDTPYVASSAGSGVNSKDPLFEMA